MECDCMKKNSITVIDKGTGNTYSGFCADSKVRYTFGYDKCKEWTNECAVLEIEPFMYLNGKPEGYFYAKIK